MLRIAINKTPMVFPYTDEMFYAENPNITLAASPTKEMLAQVGLADVIPTDPPAYDPVTQTLVQTAVQIGDEWHQQWSVVEKYNTTEDRDAAILANNSKEFMLQAATINTQRDGELLQGVLYNGVLYHSDDSFRADLSDMLLGYDKGLLSGTQLVRAKDNTMHELDYNAILALKLAIGLHRKSVYAASWAAKDALRTQLGLL